MVPPALVNSGLNSNMGVMLKGSQVTTAICPLSPRSLSVGLNATKNRPQQDHILLKVAAKQKLFTQRWRSDSQYFVTYTQVKLGSSTGTFRSGFSSYRIGKTLGIWEAGLLDEKPSLKAMLTRSGWNPAGSVGGEKSP